MSIISRKIKIFVVFTLFLLLINWIFNFYYHEKLGLDFYASTLIFSVFFVFNFVLFFHLFKNFFWRLLLVCLYFFLGAYTLINFAYYEIFHIFWRVNSGQLKSLNSSFIDLLADYYYLVPKETIYITLCFVFIVLFALIFYRKAIARINKTLAKQLDEINFLTLEVKDIYLPKRVLFALILIFNIGFVSSLHFYKQEIGQDNFSRQTYYSRLGISGYLFDDLYQKISEEFKKIAHVGSKQAAGDGLNDLELIRENMDNLKLLADSSFSSSAEYPTDPSKPHFIIYQMESVSAWPLKENPSPMPFLSKLMEEGVGADSFYPNSCITVNAEFASMCSFLPESSGPISDLYANNDYNCLPLYLRNTAGYQTSFYHANDSEFWNRKTLAPKFGFDNLYFTPYFKNRTDDAKVLAEVVENIKKSDSPTFNYVVGFTSHGPHNENFIDMNKYENDLIIEPYKSKLSENVLSAECDQNTIRNYFGFLRAVDDGIRKLFENLEANDLLDKTVVIIYGDHKYYNFSSDDAVKDFNNSNQIPFAMHLPGGYGGSVKKIASHLDIAPTILDIIDPDGEYEEPENFIGQSLFSDEHPESVINKCLGESYYLSQDILIKNYSQVGVSKVTAYFHDYAKIKNNNYINSFTEIIKRSDKMVKENNLVVENFDRPVLAKKGQMELDLNQSTDTDKDGLSDLREKSLGTDRLNPDSDGDGFYDGVEVVNGYNPLGQGRVED